MSHNPELISKFALFLNNKTMQIINSLAKNNLNHLTV